MSDQSKTLLSEIRARLNTNPYSLQIFGGRGHYTAQPASPFDEMLELYITARSQHDKENLREKLEAEKENFKLEHEEKIALSKQVHELWPAKARAEQALEIYANFLRPGDVVVGQDNYGGVSRRKIVSVKVENSFRTEGPETIVGYHEWRHKAGKWEPVYRKRLSEFFDTGLTNWKIERADDKKSAPKKKKKKPKKSSKKPAE